MIFTERTITVINDSATINKPLILYRGDKNIELKITIAESQFKFRNNDASNVIETTDASYAQLVINTPYNSPIFSDVAVTKNGAVIFVITEAMIDEIREVGAYEIQIRLLDDNKQSRASIPPVSNAIEIREPIAIEDGSAVDSNAVNVAKVNRALTTTSAPLEVFDSQGNYIKNNWGDGDLITDAALNKMEAGIDGVNKKIANNSSQIKEKANEVDLNIERERINNIVKNTGTSVNDLELQDIRVSYDGKTYSSAGESVRSQVEKAMSSIYDLEHSLNIFDNSQPFIEGKCISNWDVGSTTYNDLYDTERLTSYIIPIEPNTKYIFLKNDGTNQGSIQAYGIYDKTGKSLYYGTGGVTEIQENQAYLRFSANTNDAKEVVNIQPYDANKGLEGYTIQEFGFAKKDKFVLKQEFNSFKESLKNKTPYELEKPVIVFMFDSSYDNNTCGILKKYGFNGTYHLGNSNTNFDSLKEGIKQLVFEGHDIGVYAGNGTRPTTYVGSDSDEWYNYMKKAVDDLRVLGIYSPTVYGCARNQGSVKIYEFAKQLGFKYVRCNYKVVNGETWESEGTVFEDWKNNTPNNLNLCPYNMPEKTFDEIKTTIDYAIANNKILPLFTHGAPTVGDSINVSYDIFEQVCSYVKDKVELGEIEVLTARQLWNKYNEQEGRWRDYISILSSIISKY